MTSRLKQAAIMLFAPRIRLEGTLTTGWSKQYRRLLGIVDAGAILWAMSGALVLRFGTPGAWEGTQTEGPSYVIVTLVLAGVWWSCLGFWRSREASVLGYGTDEFKRVLSASFWLFGFIATFSYIFQFEIARGYIILALPAGALSLMVARVLVR